MDDNKITVNYFDLGLHRGLEMDKFLHDTKELPCTVHIHGIEADPNYAKMCHQRFDKDDRVTIHNFAVGLEDGFTSLYLMPSGYGSSIYADKRQVTKLTKRVAQRRLSTFIRDLGLIPKPKNTIAILKVNIEGAEWDLIRDLDRSNLFGYFDMICCPNADPVHEGEPVFGWGLTRDMCKVPSLSQCVKEAQEILRKHGVVTESYVAYRGAGGVVEDIDGVIDMRQVVRDLIRSLGG